MTVIHYTQLPPEALMLISDRQKTYIDEFSFIEDEGKITAMYGGEALAIWDGVGWTLPNPSDLHIFF